MEQIDINNTGSADLSEIGRWIVLSPEEDRAVRQIARQEGVSYDSVVADMTSDGLEARGHSTSEMEA